MLADLLLSLGLALSGGAVPSAAADRLEERARALFVSGDRAGAYPLLTRLAERENAPTWAVVYKATDERDRGELARAVRTLDAAWIPARPDRAIGLELAATLSWMQRLDAALSIYERLLEVDADDIEAALGRARMLRWSGRPAAARRQLQRVLARNPDHADALAALAATQLDDRRHRDARAALDRLSAVDADHPEVDDLEARLEAQWRWTVAAEAGATVEGDATPLVAGRFEARFVRAVGLYGQWARRGLRPGDTFGATDSGAHVARAGLMGEVARATGWSAGARAVVAPSTTQGFAEVGVSQRFRPPVGIAVTARVGADDRSTMLVGGDATVSGSPATGWTVLAQTFVGAAVTTPEGAEGPPRPDVAALAGADRDLGTRVTLGVRGGWASNQAGQFGLASASLRAAVHRNLALTARYEVIAGPFVRHTVVAGLEARW